MVGMVASRGLGETEVFEMAYIIIWGCKEVRNVLSMACSGNSWIEHHLTYPLIGKGQKGWATTAKEWLLCHATIGMEKSKN